MHLKRVVSNKVTRNAILYTVFILVIYRIGSFVLAPGVSQEAVNQVSSGALQEWYSIIGGGLLGQMTLFSLGVGPYITASIVIQLLETELVPKMSDWKHQGVQGQNKRSKYTKILAIIFAIVQAVAISLGMFVSFQTQLVEGTWQTYVVVALTITAGTSALIWLSDRITENGIGNGISVVIMAGIIASMPNTFIQIADQYFTGSTVVSEDIARNTVLWSILFVVQLLLIIVVIYFNLGQRRIKINYVRSSRGKADENSYLPIKINPAGVIPVIFVSPLMLAPIYILNLVPAFKNNGVGTMEQWVRNIFDYTSADNEYWYLAAITYFLMIVGFSVLYSHIQMNPESVAENLEKQTAYIVGVRSGEETERYLEKVITRTSIWGGLMLGGIAVLPILITQFANVSINLSLFGTGLIITVSVLVQTYEGLVTKTEKSSYRRIFGVAK